MSQALDLRSVKNAVSRWWFICLALSFALTAVACAEREVFAGEPIGTIAFTSNRDGNAEIYLTNPEGTRQINITNHEAEDLEPAWSPDGSRIAFSSHRDGGANIYVMDADGGNVVQLTDSPLMEGGPRWSPDGRRIAFYSFREQDKQLLWVMDADGSNLQAPLEDLMPAPHTGCAGGFPGSWTPDGRQIIFRGSHGTTRALQICSVALEGRIVEVVFTSDGTFSYFPSLSPDGRQIAFTSNRGETTSIYVVNAEGGRIRRVTDDAGTDEYPTWSPDGQWIAFHSDRNGDGAFNIFIVRPNGDDLRQVTNTDANDMQPAWSPQ